MEKKGRRTGNGLSPNDFRDLAVLILAVPGELVGIKISGAMSHCYAEAKQQFANHRLLRLFLRRPRRRILARRLLPLLHPLLLLCVALLHLLGLLLVALFDLLPSCFIGILLR